MHIGHIALLVKDLDKARYFYEKILQLPLADRPNFSIKGVWYSLGGAQLHLAVCEDMPRPHRHREYEEVQPHFALSLTNEAMESLIQRLNKAGIPFISKPEEFPKGILQAFFYDPDGNMLEINNAPG